LKDSKLHILSEAFSSFFHWSLGVLAGIWAWNGLEQDEARQS
jgi:hypothetical protein